MTLPYTGQTLDIEGTTFHVLDSTCVDFNGQDWHRKKGTTLVRNAQGGELTGPVHVVGRESDIYVAQPGDAIFDQGENDRYVPPFKGRRLRFEDLGKAGYTTAETIDPDNIRVNSPGARVLAERVTKPTLIPNAWGPGDHQRLYPGAVLRENKDVPGGVSGIEQKAFETNWEPVPVNGTDLVPVPDRGPRPKY